MTQAFNLSQLANRVNTSGQLDISTGATGTLPSANLPVVPISKGGTNNGSLAVTSGGILYTDGSKAVNSGAGTAGQYLQSNGSSAPSWVDINVGGMTLLATITATSGNSVSASGLDLTSYKALKIYGYRISNNSGNSSFVAMSSDNSQSSSYQITQAATSTATQGFIAELDLTNSIFISTSFYRITSTIISDSAGTSNISTSSSIIYFRWSLATSFDDANGQILIYGVK